MRLLTHPGLFITIKNLTGGWGGVHGGGGGGKKQKQTRQQSGGRYDKLTKENEKN